MSIVLTGTESVILTSDSDVELTVNVEYTDAKNGVATDHQRDGSTRDSVEIVGPPPQLHTRTVTRISVRNQQRAGQAAIVITAAGSSVFTGTLQAGDSVDFDGSTFTHAETGGDGHSGSGGGGSLPAPWTATDANLVIPVDQLAGGTADAPYAISDSEAGIIVNRAGGFQGAWEVFDLGKPGVGYAKATITAADGDTLAWGADLNPALIVEVSADASEWATVYGGAVAQPAVMLLTSFGTPADPVATFAEYVLFTPRGIRFAVGITDAITGLIYDGPQDPTLAYDFAYTAG